MSSALEQLAEMLKQASWLVYRVDWAEGAYYVQEGTLVLDKGVPTVMPGEVVASGFKWWMDAYDYAKHLGLVAFSEGHLSEYQVRKLVEQLERPEPSVWERVLAWCSRTAYEPPTQDATVRLDRILRLLGKPKKRCKVCRGGMPCD